jgi:hypothetical protein
MILLVSFISMATFMSTSLLYVASVVGSLPCLRKGKTMRVSMCMEGKDSDFQMRLKNLSKTLKKILQGISPSHNIFHLLRGLCPFLICVVGLALIHEERSLYLKFY